MVAAHGIEITCKAFAGRATKQRQVNRLISNKMGKSCSFEDFVSLAKSIHGEKYKYDKNSYIGITKKLNIYCEKHGWFEQTGQNHTRVRNGNNLFGCTLCGREHAAEESKKRYYDEDLKKYCSGCKKYLCKTDFKIYNNKIESKCTECKKADDRARSLRPDVKDRNKISIRKFMQSQKYKDRLLKEKSLRFERNIGLVVKITPFRCNMCNVAFVAKGENKYDPYCAKCNRSYKQRRKKGNHQSICPDCGIKHIACWKISYCESCKKKRMSKYKKALKNKRKAIIKSSSYGETVYADKVFNRDRWRCYICNIKVQKRNLIADNAAELDHVIPLSKGGVHTYTNVKTCCRKCNREKSNALIGQLVINI